MWFTSQEWMEMPGLCKFLDMVKFEKDAAKISVSYNILRHRPIFSKTKLFRNLSVLCFFVLILNKNLVHLFRYASLCYPLLSIIIKHLLSDKSVMEYIYLWWRIFHLQTVLESRIAHSLYVLESSSFPRKKLCNISSPVMYIVHLLLLLLGTRTWVKNRIWIVYIVGHSPN